MIELEFEKPDACPNAATCVEVAMIPAGESFTVPAGSILVGRMPTVEWLDHDTVQVTVEAVEAVRLVYNRAEWLAFLGSCKGKQYEI